MSVYKSGVPLYTLQISLQHQTGKHAFRLFQMTFAFSVGKRQCLDTFVKAKKEELDTQQKQLRSEFDGMISEHEAKVKAWEKASAEDAAQNMRLQAEIDAEKSRQAAMAKAQIKAILLGID